LQGFDSVEFTKHYNAETTSKDEHGKDDYHFHSEKKVHIKDNEIVNISVKIADFPDPFSPMGEQSYPFSITLPNWLPASLAITTKHEKAKLSIMHGLIAQVDPVDDLYWEDQAKTLSTYRSDFSIFIVERFHDKIQPGHYFRSSFESEAVGGFIGIGRFSATTEVFLEKKRFRIGEPISVRLKCDNSKVRKAVKYI